MPNKDATLILLQITSDLIRNQEYLKNAITLTNYLLTQGILYDSKSDRMALYFVNANSKQSDTDFESLIDLSKPTFNNLIQVQKFCNVLKTPEFRLTNDTSMREIFDFAEDFFDEKIGKKKFNKKLLILSAGDGEINLTKEDARRTADMLKEKNIKTNFISVFFWDKENPNKNQLQTKDFIQEMVNYSFPVVRIFDSGVVQSILEQFKTKKRSNVSTFRGNFELAPNCSLKVACFSKTRDSQNFDFKKYAKRGKNNIVKDNDMLETKRVYIDPTETNFQPIDNKTIRKGYYYGQDLIEITEEAEKKISYKLAKRCFKLLGFIEEANFQRHLAIGPVECVLPEKGDQKNIRAFNSIVQSMINLNKLAVARIVKAANRAPKITVLFPKKKEIKTDKYVYMLYMSELPTSEDMRMYNFGSSKISSEKERSLMRKLINRMDITNFQTEDGEEELVRPKEMPNPRHQVMYTRIIQKGLGLIDSSAPLVIDEKIDKVLFPEKMTHPKVGELTQEIKDTFNLEKQKEVEEKPEKVYWREILKKEKGLTVEEETALKAKNKDDEPRINKISKEHPISDFRDMLSNRTEDLVDAAVKQMQVRIVEMVRNSIKDSGFEKALECLRVLREGCINEEEHILFNNFMGKLKMDFYQDKNFEIFLAKIRTNKVTLITNKESSRSEVTEEQAREFLEE